MILVSLTGSKSDDVPNVVRYCAVAGLAKLWVGVTMNANEHGICLENEEIRMFAKPLDETYSVAVSSSVSTMVIQFRSTSSDLEGEQHGINRDASISVCIANAR